MTLAEFRKRLEDLDCRWVEARIEVRRGEYRTGVKLVTKKGGRERTYLFFADDVDIPVPSSFIEAVCRKLDLNSDSFVSGLN